MRPPRALPAAHFDRNERYAYFGDRTLATPREFGDEPGFSAKSSFVLPQQGTRPMFEPFSGPWLQGTAAVQIALRALLMTKNHLRQGLGLELI